MSGASAGGMTSAISALHAFRDLDHVWPGTSPPPPRRNRLYSSWVTDISLRALLETTDLEDGRNAAGVMSMLCCDVLDRIVASAFDLDRPVRRRKCRSRRGPLATRDVDGYGGLGLPYMYRSVDAGLRAIDVRTLTEAAESQGAGAATILFHIILPNIRSAILSGAFLTFAIVIGEFTFASLLDRPAFGPYLQLIGASRAYEPAALAVMAFALIWACLGLIQLVGGAPAPGVRR
jgi:hypothetical protein